MEDKGEEQEEIRRRKRRRREVEENEEEEKEPLSISYCFAALLTIRHSVCAPDKPLKYFLKPLK